MTPSLLSSSRAHDGTVELTAAGAWTAPDAAGLERLVQGIAAKSDASSTAIDMRGVELFDAAVDQRTPNRIDTVVSMDFLGLTGSPVISLIGGTSERPLVGENGHMPILVADAAANQSMSQAARDVLRRFEELLAENAQPPRGMIGNLDAFAGALARNSDHLDGIVAGLERMTGSAAAKARLVTYDPTVPHAGRRPKNHRPRSGWCWTRPPSPQDTEKVRSASADGAFANLPDAQWSDALPKLVQVTILHSVEDASRFSEGSRPVEGLRTTFNSSSISASSSWQPTATLTSSSGARSSPAAAGSSPCACFGCLWAGAVNTPAAAAVLDRAFGQAGSDLVTWVGHAVNEPTLPKAALPRRTSGGLSRAADVAAA